MCVAIKQFEIRDYFDRFWFLFLEVGSQISKLLCNYPTRCTNFKSCFSDNQMKLVLFLSSTMVNSIYCGPCHYRKKVPNGPQKCLISLRPKEAERVHLIIKKLSFRVFWHFQLFSVRTKLDAVFLSV